MKIKFKPRHNHNHNDCWCDALAFALNKPYEEIYELFKPFVQDTGLNESFIKGQLYNNNFLTWTVTNEEDVTIKDFMQNYNTYDNLCVLFIKDHVFFATNACIYDNIKTEERNKFLDRRVEGFALKPKEESE